MQTKKLQCKFCGNTESESNLYYSDHDKHACICLECIRKCYKLGKSNTCSNSKNIVYPSQIKKHLDNYIIGQEDAKRIISVAAFKHLMRNKNPNVCRKNNILIIGPSGTGKTYMMKVLSEFISVPCVVVDATPLTESGYVGEDVASILQQLLEKCDGNVSKAENGIVVIDEIDKKSRKGANPSLSRDVSGEGVQNSILKMIEGTTVNVHAPGTRKHPHQIFTKVKTDNIMFVFLGAFVGLNDIVYKRLGRSRIGFDQPVIERNIVSKVEQEDLIEFGMIPELVNRIHNYVCLSDLTYENLYDILRKPQDNIIIEYQELLKDKLSIDFTNNALVHIAQHTFNKNLGARGLQKVIDSILNDIIYDIGDKKKYIKIDAESDKIYTRWEEL